MKETKTSFTSTSDIRNEIEQYRNNISDIFAPLNDTTFNGAIDILNKMINFKEEKINIDTVLPEGTLFIQLETNEVIGIIDYENDKEIIVTNKNNDYESIDIDSDSLICWLIDIYDLYFD